MKKNILHYLKENLEASPKEIADYFDISRQIVHRYLKQLSEEDKISKIGKSPLVYYQYKFNAKKNTAQISRVGEPKESYGELDFIEITVDGRFLNGNEAFAHWCETRNQPFEKTLVEYKKTLLKYKKYFKNGIIDGTEKLINTKDFAEIGIKKLYYIDFYAIERFGKTTLGKLMHYGKQSQSKKLIAQIITLSKPKIEQIITQNKIDAVGYIPPTLQRNVQIMSEMEKGFDIKLPHIKITKIKGEIVVPQKALSKIKDRILNTQKSIVVNEKRKYDRILLIDDAVGSGATLNETACKIIKKGIAKEVIAVAITGSYKGFEVISEA